MQLEYQGAGEHSAHRGNQGPGLPWEVGRACLRVTCPPCWPCRPPGWEREGVVSVQTPEPQPQVCDSYSKAPSPTSVTVLAPWGSAARTYHAVSAVPCSPTQPCRPLLCGHWTEGQPHGEELPLRLNLPISPSPAMSWSPSRERMGCAHARGLQRGNSSEEGFLLKWRR